MILGVLSTPVKQEVAPKHIATAPLMIMLLILLNVWLSDSGMESMCVRFHAEIFKNERIYVGVFVDYFCHRFSRAMSGLAVDADQFRGVAGVGSLESCRILE